MDQTLHPIPIPEDSFRRQTMLFVIKNELNDQDVNFAQDYYVSSEGTPIRANTATINRINAYADSFPVNSHVLPTNPIIELLKDKYPTLVKRNEYTKLWYMIQSDSYNLLEITASMKKLSDEYYVFGECDEQYIDVVSKTLGFNCIQSKLYPQVIFIKKRDDIRFTFMRDFPIAIYRFPLNPTNDQPIPIAVCLLWIFYNFYEYMNDKVDLDILSRIDYKTDTEWFRFPHIDESLTNKIRNPDMMIPGRIDYITCESADAAATYHLTKCFRRQSIVWGLTVAWIKSVSDSADSEEKFKFLGVNEEDPITMENFSNLNGAELLKVFLSDHGHNYRQDILENYFLSLPPHIYLLPYDRDACPYYLALSRLCSLGVLPYHNKRGLFSSSKQYISNDHEWEKILEKLKKDMVITQYPYYKPSTIVNIVRLTGDDVENQLYELDEANGYFINQLTDELYPPDMFIITIQIRSFGQTHQKIYEYIGTRLTENDILKAFRNGFCNLVGYRFTTFSTINNISDLADEEGQLNDYLTSLIRKYINSSSN